MGKPQIISLEHPQSTTPPMCPQNCGVVCKALVREIRRGLKRTDVPQMNLDLRGRLDSKASCLSPRSLSVSHSWLSIVCTQRLPCFYPGFLLPLATAQVHSSPQIPLG